MRHDARARARSRPPRRHRLLRAACVPVGGAAGIVAALLFVSPGAPAPYLDRDGNPVPGSLAEKGRVEINGASQGFFIKSRDVRNPVLLYLHGGMPDYFLTQEHPTGLDEHFTVVWWEQRGSGLSYDPRASPEALTIDQLVADTLAMTNHLRARFGQEKIYLMGHSGGTFLGVQAVARAPALYHAYIGIAQMTSQRESERLAYEHMLARYRAVNDARMVEKLERAPVTEQGELPAAYVALRDDAMHRLGIGTMRETRSLVTGIVLPSLLFREYTLGEKLTLWRAKSRSGISVVWDAMTRTDLRTAVTKLDVPVYFLHGVHDYTVSYPLAKGYLESLDAPVKGFYTFDASAHSPLFEEPEKVNRILRHDVCTGRSDLADGAR